MHGQTTSPYQGLGKKCSYFEGWYFKHVCGSRLLALIPGIQMDQDGRRSAFIQIISNEGVWQVSYPFSAFRASSRRMAVQIGDSVFSDSGVKLHMEGPGLSLHGCIRYGWMLPLRYDIMGPFRMLPGMECRHGVVSLGHELEGTIRLNGHNLSFTGGTGYIEKDWGRSFPSRYLWTQCNTFPGERISVMAAAASIPLTGLRFPGCIAAVHYQGQEYRLATYWGCRVSRQTEDMLILYQRRYRLEAQLLSSAPLPLLAPDRGGMTRTIYEHAACRVRYRFWQNGHLLFDLESDTAGFESVR